MPGKVARRTCCWPSRATSVVLSWPRTFWFGLSLPAVARDELDNPLHGVEHTGEGLLKIIAKDKDFIGCFPGESPGRGNSAVDCGLAGLLDARVDDSIPRQPPIIIEGKGKA
jgi:hypothetical protein